MNRRIVAGLLFGSALMLAGCIPPPPAPIPPPMAEAIPNPPVSPVPQWQPKLPSLPASTSRRVRISPSLKRRCNLRLLQALEAAATALEPPS